MALLYELAPVGGPRSWNVVSALSVPTGMIWSCVSATRSRKALPATANRGRWRWRLRLAAYELLRAEGGDPVLLLDDVFAELDSARRQALANVAASAEQVLVTAAVHEDIPADWDVTQSRDRHARR